MKILSTLRSKLIASYSLLVLFAALQGLASLMSLGQVLERTQSLTSTWIPAVEQTGQLLAIAHEYRLAQITHIYVYSAGTAEPEKADALLGDAVGRFKAGLENLKQYLADQEMNDFHQQLSKQWVTYLGMSDRIQKLSLKQEPVNAYDAFNGPAGDAYSNFVATIAATQNHARQQAEAARQASQRSQSFAQGSVMAGIGFSLVLGIPMALFTALLLIGRPVRRLVEAFGVFSTGDLTSRIESRSGDEIGQLARGADSFVQSLRAKLGLVGRSCDTANQLGTRLGESMASADQAVEQIGTALQAMSGRLGEQIAEVNANLKTVEDIAAAIEHLARIIGQQGMELGNSSASIEEMLANIAMVGRNMEQLRRLAQELMESFTVAQQEMGSTSQHIAQVSDQSANLSQINTVIQDISEQTNLLAMNAAIEAAHAGEQGKGFGVVAGEIRKLAEMANGQARQSNENLTAIAESIQRMVESSRRVEQSFARNSGLAGQVQQISAQTSHAMEEQNTASQHVMEGIASLQAITRQIEGEAGSMQDGAGRIREAIRRIHGRSTSNAAAIETINQNAASIVDSVHQANELSDQTRDAIQTIRDETAAYRI